MTQHEAAKQHFIKTASKMETDSSRACITHPPLTFDITEVTLDTVHWYICFGSQHIKAEQQLLVLLIVSSCMTAMFEVMNEVAFPYRTQTP